MLLLQFMIVNINSTTLQIPVRYGGLPPSLAMQRQGQPHVSSSTHPQNMGKENQYTYFLIIANYFYTIV